MAAGDFFRIPLDKPAIASRVFIPPIGEIYMITKIIAGTSSGQAQHIRVNDGSHNCILFDPTIPAFDVFSCRIIIDTEHYFSFYTENTSNHCIIEGYVIRDSINGYMKDIPEVVIGTVIYDPYDVGVVRPPEGEEWLITQVSHSIDINDGKHWILHDDAESKSIPVNFRSTNALNRNISIKLTNNYYLSIVGNLPGFYCGFKIPLSESEG